MHDNRHDCKSFALRDTRTNHFMCTKCGYCFDERDVVCWERYAAWYVEDQHLADMWNNYGLEAPDNACWYRTAD